nr:hypothetical protein [Tanacetum cinerariifolium]
MERPSRRRRSCRRRPMVFKEKAGGLLQTQQRLDSEKSIGFILWENTSSPFIKMNLEEIYKMMNDGVEYPRTQNASLCEIKEPYEPSHRMYLYEQPSCLGSTFVGKTLRKSDQLHQTFNKRPIAMIRKLDEMIGLPKSQPKRTYNEDLECEIVMVKMPKCMAWLDDESLGDLDMMEDKMDNPSPQNDVEEFLLNDNLNRDLGNFLQDNNLFLDYKTNSPFPDKSSREIWSPTKGFQYSDNDFGSRIDELVAIDDLWGNLDSGALKNKSSREIWSPTKGFQYSDNDFGSRIDELVAIDDLWGNLDSGALKIQMPVHIIVKDIRTMDMTINQQVALDEARVTHASRLRIGKSNFHLRSDITSKESNLQLATAIVHHHSIRFKMNNKKHIVNLEYFREMLHICSRLPNQTFNELPFEEEILAFLRYLRHSEEIKKITNVNINKLHQPRRSFAAVINKCLSGKSTGYDNLWLSQAQILWGMYHKKNVDFAYLLWEDFVYQVEHKDAKKSNEMYYPRFTKFGAILPIELTNKDIRNSAAYKKYYAVASGAAPPKTKASVRKNQSSSNTTITPPMAAGTRLSTSAKGKQHAKSSKAKDDNDDDQDTNNDGDDFVHPKLSIHEEEAKDEESFDPIVQTPKNSNDEGNDDASLGMNVGGEEGQDAEDDDEELYRDVNINLEGRDVQMKDVHTTQEFKDTHVTLTLVNLDGQQQSSSVSSQFVTSMLHPSPDAGIDSFFESTPWVDVQASTTVAPLTLTALTLPLPTIPTISQVPQAPTPPTTTPITFMQDLPNFGSLFGFNHRLKTLEANFSEFMQTNQFAGVVSSIPEIVERYLDQRMNEVVKVAVQIQSDRLQDEAQAENEEFLNKLDENIQNIIKEQVKEQVKLKKIIIKKIESNKSIHRSDEQRNLYKALVDAYECDKIILDTYRDTVTLKRCRDDADKDEKPSDGSDRGSKRRREGKEPESTTALNEKASKTTGKSTEGSKSHQKTASESAPAEEPIQTTQDLEEPLHQEFKTGAANDQPIAEASQHPKWFQKQKKPPTPNCA